MAREVISTGNELAAMAAVDAGARFFGGYPITPSSEVMHVASDLLPKVGGTAIQMEDEIGGISAALGASMAGVKSFTATSGPGISLKAEQIGLGFIAAAALIALGILILRLQGVTSLSPFGAFLFFAGAVVDALVEVVEQSQVQSPHVWAALMQKIKNFVSDVASSMLETYQAYEKGLPAS